MLTPAMVRQLAPELASQSDSRINMIIDMAKPNLSEAVWGDIYDRGLNALTCHFLTCLERQATTGTSSSVTQKKVGELSVSFSPTDMSDESLGSTTYGSMYKMLRGTIPYTPVVSGC